METSRFPRVRYGRRRRKRRARSLWPVSCAQDKKLIQLIQWMKQKAGFSVLLYPAVFSETGRGLMTRTSIKPGETVVSLPYSLMITTDTVLASDIKDIIKGWEPRLTPQHCLAIFLVWEKYKGESSSWFPYIDTLPGTFTTPAYFTDTELSGLPPTVQSFAKTEVNKLKGLYEMTRTFSSAKWRMFSDILTFESFKWAWNVVNTRSVYFEVGNNKYLCDKEPNNIALAPYLDLLNHSSTADIKARFNTDSQHYEIITYDSYKAYDQVFISYGCHSNQKLFLDYGFCVPNNPQDAVEISYDSLLKACGKQKIEHTEKKFAMLRENNLLSNLCCSMDGMSWNLQAVLSMLSMDWRELQNWSSIFTEEMPTNMLTSQAKVLAMDILQDKLATLKKAKSAFIQMEKDLKNQYHKHFIEVLLKMENDIISASLLT